MLRWPRLVAEDRRFGTLGPKANGMSAEHFDGIMVMDLLSGGALLSLSLGGMGASKAYCALRSAATSLVTAQLDTMQSSLLLCSSRSLTCDKLMLKTTPCRLEGAAYRGQVPL